MSEAIQIRCFHVIVFFCDNYLISSKKCLIEISTVNNLYRKIQLLKKQQTYVLEMLYNPSIISVLLVCDIFK